MMSHEWTPERARHLAEFAHHGQVDKVGVPYIQHLTYVAANARAQALVSVSPFTNKPYTGEQVDWVEMTGWLHDIVEDTDITLDMLHDWGLPPAVHRPVRVLTHLDDSPNEEYWASCYELPVARIVKKVDVHHNRSRLHLIEDEPTRERLTRKYDRATEIFGSVYEIEQVTT